MTSKKSYYTLVIEREDTDCESRVAAYLTPIDAEEAAAGRIVVDRERHCHGEGVMSRATDPAQRDRDVRYDLDLAFGDFAEFILKAVES